MWLLSKIINKDYDKFNVYSISTDLFSMDDIESLVFVNAKTNEARLIPFDNCSRSIKSSIESITSYISDSLDNEEFIGIYNDFLFCINKYELKIADYFEDSGVVKRKTSKADFYSATTDEKDNPVIVSYNYKGFSIMKLLLTHPDVFVFEKDAFYYELSDFDLALKYTYTQGKEKFDIALTKLRIAGDY